MPARRSGCRRSGRPSSGAARIASVTRTPNRNYLFIDLVLDAKVAPGTFDITFSGAGRTTTHAYRLLARDPGSATRQGFSSKDAIYQIMPDRFANGDPSNDSMTPMADKLNRANGGGRRN